jgi:DMSO/TMAO reductase YedYZ molybdopterin-dependent catalytic subunit
VLLAVAGCSGAPKANWQVQVSGGSEPLTLSYAALTRMPQTELKDVLMQKSRGEDEVHSFTGVALSQVLKQAGVAEFVSVTALAADGYAVEISKDELAGGIIALKQDGEWIASDKEHGPIRLVCPQTPANRWVFQLQELQVKN